MRATLILAAILALTLAGCAKKAEAPQGTTAPEEGASAAAPAAQASGEAAAGAKVLKITLSALGGSNISGTATFTQAPDGPATRVLVALTGTSAATPLAAQLRSGTCAKLGQIDVADTWQLSGGKVEGPTFTTVDDLTAKPMAVVVIPVAAAGPPKILSCGETSK